MLRYEKQTGKRIVYGDEFVGDVEFTHARSKANQTKMATPLSSFVSSGFLVAVGNVLVCTRFCTCISKSVMVVPELLSRGMNVVESTTAIGILPKLCSHWMECCY